MYLNIMGKPADEELVKHPSVPLTSMHEWDSSVNDYSHPEGDEEPSWACDPQHIDIIDPNFDSHGQYTRRAINILPFLADIQHRSLMATSSTLPITQAHKHCVSQKHLITTNLDLNLDG